MTDQPGLLSEVSAELVELGCHISALGCHVSACVAWTHKHQGACIIYVNDQELSRPTTDQKCLFHISTQQQGLF